MNKKGIIIFIIGVIIVFFFVFRIISSAFPNPESIKLNKKEALEFITEIEKNGKIFELDDCKRYSKRFNGISIKMNEKGNDEVCGTYFEDVLENQKISKKEFEKFRLYLEKSKLRSYYRTENYSVFIVDGFLDSVWGFLYNHSTKELGNEYFNAGTYKWKKVKNLGDNWYRIGGT